MNGSSHGTTFPCPHELSLRAVRMVAEVREDCPNETAAPQAVTEKLGIGSRETWPKPAVTTRTATANYGKAVAQAWDRVHLRLTHRAAWLDHEGELPWSRAR